MQLLICSRDGLSGHWFNWRTTFSTANLKKLIAPSPNFMESDGSWPC